MKPTNIVKVNPIIELTAPILLQCKSGECGTCPTNTGKLLWIPFSSGAGATFNFQYNFFDKSAESTGSIKWTQIRGDYDYLNGSPATYFNPPNRNYAVTNHVAEYPNLSPSLMKGSSFLTQSLNYNNAWVYFKQPNPAIGNIHDALCFEYNHEKRLITFRSF